MDHPLFQLYSPTSTSQQAAQAPLMNESSPQTRLADWAKQTAQVLSPVEPSSSTSTASSVGGDELDRLFGLTGMNVSVSISSTRSIPYRHSCQSPAQCCLHAVFQPGPVRATVVQLDLGSCATGQRSTIQIFEPEWRDERRPVDLDDATTGASAFSATSPPNNTTHH